ncbi:hypothetical protein [Pseudonocardia sp. HH130630-07]|uniref:hypothetical protein n=1 Tax=Pseudonocardia sp. HH130630-07 TaxID=1690815 RepID=UPI000814BFE6|nr:hypothetical protein [Pseudonocardia sp. HH130630-07]ANY08656.1 hypothetical protein AFB00_23010 [Pseudonocardia sp. HH130630-07]
MNRRWADERVVPGRAGRSARYGRASPGCPCRDDVRLLTAELAGADRGNCRLSGRRLRSPLRSLRAVWLDGLPCFST